MTSTRALTLLLALGALAVAAVAAPTAAAGQAPCWKRLLNDWYDGRIDNAYQVHCYRDAIRNLPEDVEAYTEAREDIQRALLAAIRSSGGEMDPTDVVPPQPAGSGKDAPGGDGGDDEPGDGAPGPGDEGDPGDEGEPEAAPGGDGGDDEGLIGFFRPSNADEIPLPLLVLAGLALALLAAAAASFVARRVQARKLRPAGVNDRSAPPDA
ncbi:MAG TPA: hypothetical protein VM290_06720 [Gaiellaceae bacterium]|nr:hypothetical protein [Gaiellaceae bacterium]